MGRNLGPLNIKDSYEGLVQISGSQLTDGSGSLIPSLDVTASFATSASFATTASFALNVTPIDTGSLMVTGSVTDATLTFTKGDASTFDLVVNNVVNATSASFATTATNAVSASIANSATTAVLATTASHAIFADTASFLPADTNLNINSITASNASFTSASIGYLQTVTGSATIIGDAFIILNNDTPTQRFAGLKVYDSGSANVTASLAWDGLTHDWKYEYSSSAEHEGGVLLTGPEGDDLATLPYPANNVIQKGTGTHHLASSSITDDGTLVTIGGKLTQGTGTLTNGSDKGAIIGANGATLSGNTTGQAIAGGDGPSISGRNSFVGGGSTANITVLNSGIVAGRANQITAGQRSFIGGGNSNEIKTSATDSNAILGGSSNDITAGTNNAIVAGTLNVNTNTRSVIVGGTGLTTTKDDEVVVPHLTISGSTIATDISASGYVSASSFIGDGSQLSGISTDPFPYTGSAEITGSLKVDGNLVSGNPDNTATGIYSAVVGGGLSGTDANEVSGNYSGILAGTDNVITSTKSAIAGGDSNSITGFEFNFIGGGGNATIGSGGKWSGIIGGFGNNLTSSQYGFMGGGRLNTLTGQGAAIIAGEGNQATGQYAVILGGNSNTASIVNSAVMGGAGNTAAGNQATVVGGFSNDATATQAFIGGGGLSDVTAQRGAVVGGYTHNVAAEDGVCIGGYDNNVLATHARSVVLGGTLLSTTKADEVVVPSLSIYGDTLINDGVTTGQLIDNIGQTVVSVEDAVQHIVHCTQAEYDAITPDANTLYVIDGAETLGDTNVDGKLTGTVNTISNVGGTVALDCSVGNYFTLAMPAGGTTNLVPSNVTAGQTINIEITQNATAATLTYDNTIEFPGGTAFTISTGAGQVDVLTLVSFDGVNLKATGLANFS